MKRFPERNDQGTKLGDKVFVGDRVLYVHGIRRSKGVAVQWQLSPEPYQKGVLLNNLRTYTRNQFKMEGE